MKPILKFYFLFLAALVACVTGNGDMNDNYKEVKFDTEGLELVPDVFAKYQNGIQGIADHINANIKFPASARERGVRGRVRISYVVNTLGNVEHITVINSVDKELDAEAIRVISLMKPWKPAIKNGNPIRIEYQQPFRFK